MTKRESLEELIAKTKTARDKDAVHSSALSHGPMEAAALAPVRFFIPEFNEIPDFKGSDIWRYLIKGEAATNNDVKKYILQQTSLGKSLAKIARENPSNFPSIYVIYRWLKEEESFRKAYDLAKEVRAEYLDEDALHHALNPDMEAPGGVAAAKLAHEALSKRAAQLNRQFLDKQVIEHKNDPLDMANLDDLKTRLNALLAIPEVAKAIGSNTVPAIIDVTPKQGAAMASLHESDPLDEPGESRTIEITEDINDE